MRAQPFATCTPSPHPSVPRTSVHAAGCQKWGSEGWREVLKVSRGVRFGWAGAWRKSSVLLTRPGACPPLSSRTNPGPCSRHSGLTSGLEHDRPGRPQSVVTNRGLWPQFLYLVKVKVLPAQLCPTPFNPTDCIARQAPLSLGILQARILEWVAIPFSRGSSPPRDQSRVFCTAGRFFTFWAPREAP